MTNNLNEEFNLIVFGKIPKHEDLCCIVATIYADNKNEERLPNTDFHWQIFRCRHLIYSLPEVIASPVLDAVRQIYIIISFDFYETGKLQDYLKQEDIQPDDPMPVTNDVYEGCLRYTMYARLAPNWNQVDKYLIQGREFLMVTSPVNAVRLDIVINEKEMYIIVWAVRLRLPHVPLEDFEHPVSSKPLSSDFVWDLSSSPHWIHVLPSLKRGRVTSLTGRIPETSVFKSYKHLRRHWKNMITGFGNLSSTPPDLHKKIEYNRNIRQERVYETDSMKSQQLSMCTPSQTTTQTHQAYFNNTGNARISSGQEKKEVLVNRPHSPPPFIPNVPRFISNNQPLQTKFIPIFAPHPKKRTAFLRETNAVAEGPNIFNHSVQNVSQMSVIRSPKSTNHLFTQSAIQMQSSILSVDKAKLVKKPRSRPQLQPELDIAKLAHGRQAEKEGLQLANTTTLIAFLRAQGIPCKVKDKKADLISKVLTHFNIPQPSSTQQQLQEEQQHQHQQQHEEQHQHQHQQQQHQHQHQHQQQQQQSPQNNDT